LLLYKNQNWMPIKLAWNDIIILAIMIFISIFSRTQAISIQYYIMLLTFLYICFLMYKHGIKNLISLFK